MVLFLSVKHQEIQHFCRPQFAIKHVHCVRRHLQDQGQDRLPSTSTSSRLHAPVPAFTHLFPASATDAQEQSFETPDPDGIGNLTALVREESDANDRSNLGWTVAWSDLNGGSY